MNERTKEMSRIVVSDEDLEEKGIKPSNISDKRFTRIAELVEEGMQERFSYELDCAVRDTEGM